MSGLANRLPPALLWAHSPADEVGQLSIWEIDLVAVNEAVADATAEIITPLVAAAVGQSAATAGAVPLASVAMTPVSRAASPGVALQIGASVPASVITAVAPATASQPGALVMAEIEQAAPAFLVVEASGAEMRGRFLAPVRLRGRMDTP